MHEHELGSGVVVVLGAYVLIYALLVPRREVIEPGPVIRQAAE